MSQRKLLTLNKKRQALQYKQLEKGEIIEIVAEDGETNRKTSFTIQVIGIKLDCEELGTLYVVQFLDEAEFTFIVDGGTDAAQLEHGAMALLGASGVMPFLPTASGVNRHAIVVGQDFSFECPEGMRLRLYAKNVSAIRRISVPLRGWEAPREIRKYHEKLKALLPGAYTSFAPPPPQDWSKYEGGMTVLTTTATYRVTNVRENGVRWMSKDSDPLIYCVRLITGKVGGCLVFSVTPPPEEAWRDPAIGRQAINNVFRPKDHETIISDCIVSVVLEGERAAACKSPRP